MRKISFKILEILRQMGKILENFGVSGGIFFQIMKIVENSIKKRNLENYFY